MKQYFAAWAAILGFVAAAYAVAEPEPAECTDGQTIRVVGGTIVADCGGLP